MNNMCNTALTSRLKATLRSQDILTAATVCSFGSVNSDSGNVDKSRETSIV